jgi:hypothetical protein
MLISMPHGTSTIFGAFQAILVSLQTGRTLRPRWLNYREMKSSPVNSFALKLPRALLRRNKASHAPWGGPPKAKGDQGLYSRSLRRMGWDGTWPSDVTEINNL